MADYSKLNLSHPECTDQACLVSFENQACLVSFEDQACLVSTKETELH